MGRLRTTVGTMGEMIEFPSNGSTAGGYLAHSRERERARGRS